MLRGCQLWNDPASGNSKFFLPVPNGLTGLRLHGHFWNLDAAAYGGGIASAVAEAIAVIVPDGTTHSSGRYVPTETVLSFAAGSRRQGVPTGQLASSR